MIITLDLTYPRKTYRKLIDNYIFEFKMKENGIKLSSNGALISIVLYLLYTNTSLKENLNQQQANQLMKDAYSALQTAGIPTVHTLYELYKIKNGYSVHGKYLIHSLKR
jgi:hypothetical protein